MDRSALLRATLNSLAMSNVASVINANKHKKSKKDILNNERIESESEDDIKDDKLIIPKRNQTDEDKETENE